MTSIENEIYDRLKHIIDDIYRKKGIKSPEIRSHFLKPKNFKKLLIGLRDLEHIYKEQKYPINFHTTVYDILFYRVLMDRIYYEKDNPMDETSLVNYDKYVETLNEAKTKKPIEMEEKKDIEITNDDKISTKELRSIVSRYEFNASKSNDKNTKKNYLELAKKYKDIIEKREKETHDKFMSKVGKDGRWIPNKSN